MRRVGVVLHPTRSVGRALDSLQDWTAAHGLELVHLEGVDSRSGASLSHQVGACDLVAAIGGDGTVLTALHAAAPTRTPVLGVAYGSLGALTTVSEPDLPAGLERLLDGSRRPRARRGDPRLPLHADRDAWGLRAACGRARRQRRRAERRSGLGWL